MKPLFALLTLFAAMCFASMAMADTYAPPQLDRPAIVRVGDVFTVTLRCNCTDAEDTVWWPSLDGVEYLSGYMVDGQRVTEFYGGVTVMRVRATRAGTWRGALTWEVWETRHAQLVTNIGMFKLTVYDEVYLPMLISPQRSFEIPQ